MGVVTIIWSIHLCTYTDMRGLVLLCQLAHILDVASEEEAGGHKRLPVHKNSASSHVKNSLDLIVCSRSVLSDIIRKFIALCNHCYAIACASCFAELPTHSATPSSRAVKDIHVLPVELEFRKELGPKIKIATGFDF